MQQSIILPGPEGRIEGLYHKSLIGEDAPIALILPPNPLINPDGMKNHVVSSLSKALIHSGFTVLRINFRGIGRSQGQFMGGVGELSDGAAALDWLKTKNPESNLNLIAGFSFGSWIAMQLIMRRPEIKNFIVVSPPVNKHDFSFFAPCPCPGLIIQGDKDSMVLEPSVSELAQKLNKQKNIQVNYQTITGADHFYRGKLEILESVMQDYLKQKILKPKEDNKTLHKLYL